MKRLMVLPATLFTGYITGQLLAILAMYGEQLADNDFYLVCGLVLAGSISLAGLVVRLIRE